jgi:hypothetical protein
MKSIIEHAEKSELEVCGFVLAENGQLRTLVFQMLFIANKLINLIF